MTSGSRRKEALQQGQPAAGPRATCSKHLAWKQWACPAQNRTSSANAMPSAHTGHSSHSTADKRCCNCKIRVINSEILLRTCACPGFVALQPRIATPVEMSAPATPNEAWATATVGAARSAKLAAIFAAVLADPFATAPAENVMSTAFAAMSRLRTRVSPAAAGPPARADRNSPEQAPSAWNTILKLTRDAPASPARIHSDTRSARMNAFQASRESCARRAARWL
mmetsp:Transcript_17691/g.57422  ORF Transcript_17691/g.57422 Transcript_17691/m.57422 type:complete len:225 (+) Transcript_17691:506-1180(+)